MIMLWALGGERRIEAVPCGVKIATPKVEPWSMVWRPSDSVVEVSCRPWESRFRILWDIMSGMGNPLIHGRMDRQEGRSKISYSRRQNISTDSLNMFFFFYDSAPATSGQWGWRVDSGLRYLSSSFIDSLTYLSFYFCVNQISRYQRMRKKYDSFTPFLFRR